MPSFNSVGEFVAFMNRRLMGLPGVQRGALRRAGRIVLDEAKSYPGQYQAGWPALKPTTVARKSKGDSPLLETGALRDSYASSVVSHSGAAVGSNDPKATWQELGTSRGIPPRPVLALAGATKADEVVRTVGRAVHRHLSGG